MKDPLLLIPRKLGTSPWTGPGGGPLQQGRSSLPTLALLGSGLWVRAVPVAHLAQAAMAAVTSPGASSWGKWPTPGSARHS